jgi:bla regulator protein blaR1
MVEFFIKSILSLGVLYVFFLLVLSSLKTFHFNRLFLLGSLAFSLAIPFVSIPVNDTALPIIQSAGKVSLSSTIEYSGEFITNKEIEQNSTASFLPYFYAAISLILFLRFSINLFNISKTIFSNRKIKREGYTIVLLHNQIIPYSFFRYVLVNEKQYQVGAIDEALFQHEITHCRQWHSLDILMVEVLQVLFWINPFIWLMKKSIQLNHEFLADDSVLSNCDLAKYKNLLVRLVIKHNSGILISNFNFSFTKQRLKMMMKSSHPGSALMSKVLSVLTVFTVVFFISCEQNLVDNIVPPTIEDQSIFIMNGHEENWWQPILKQHAITPTAYNNFSNVFEMGTRNAINNGTVELENAFFLFRPVEFHSKVIDKNSYMMLRAPFATHNLSNDTIKAVNGNLRIFALDDDQIKSVNHIQFSARR